MAIDLMAAEEERKSPKPSQQEKIEDTNKIQHQKKMKKKKKKKGTKKKEEEKWQKGEEEEEKWLKHYSSVHQILLVGEGDFSFSLSLANAFGSASNIVTTSLDTFDEVIKKYRNAKSNLENLVNLGATVLHGVDATQMKLHTDLSMREFNRIIFNFPHAGFYGREDQIHLIRLHRNLVQGFFKNASQMLCPFGEIHVSHKTGLPYHWWNLEELAWNYSLTLMECVNFEKEDYPGYNNKRGHGARCDEPFPLGVCSTFKFHVNTQKGKTAYTCGQSFLNITETQHTGSAGVILEEGRFGRARYIYGNGHPICYPQTYNFTCMEDMFGSPHIDARNFSRNDHLLGFEYQQPYHTTALSEPPRAQPGYYYSWHPEGNDCFLSTSYQGANVPMPVNQRYFNHTDSINISTECLNIFGGYFRHNDEMFGRMDYDFYGATQGYLTNSYQIYMNEQPGRTIHGYVECLEELHHLTVLRMGRLRMLLGLDMW